MTLSIYLLLLCLFRRGGRESHLLPRTMPSTRFFVLLGLGLLFLGTGALVRVVCRSAADPTDAVAAYFMVGAHCPAMLEPASPPTHTPGDRGGQCRGQEPQPGSLGSIAGTRNEAWRALSGVCRCGKEGR